MKGEIDNDFYCVDRMKEGNSYCGSSAGNCPAIREKFDCDSIHRKYPTPEQFREEYGEEYAGHRPVWWRYADGNGIWRTKSLNAAMGVAKRENTNILIVCACTPWDRPPAEWRPL